jgi:ATP-binding cassette, subfamily F, member 3
LFSVNNLSVQFSGESLFDDISFIINKRDRIGLVGKNGAGKTTLMRIISGTVNPSNGQVSSPSESTIGYLPQELKLRSNKTVIEESLNAFVAEQALEQTIEKLTEKLTNRTDYHSEQYHDLSQKLADATERFNMLGGATQNARAEKVLLGLGFDRNDLNRQLTEFSGGWQMRVELAKILLQSPDLIMLDEPTNHLDIDSIQWLESFLLDYPGSVMVVSHDRAFLDNVTNRTIELSLGKAYDYKACYSDYEMLRQERLEQEMSAWNNQQRQIAQVERFITRFRAKATKARQVQSRVKLLEKMEKIEVEAFDTSSIHFRFPEAPASGKVVLEAENISKSYGSNEVLRNINFILARGERLAFVGRNGEGKTTLSRIIIGELQHEGKIKLGHNVKIGYYAQNQAEYLDPDRTVFQTLDDVATGEIRKQVRNILGSFLFGGDDIDKKVQVLSGGEKSRLAIAKLLLEPVNLLVLDEPTNHLDMRSKDILKNALLQFTGTIIVVSHDRDFLQGLTDKTFEFKNKNIKEYLGDIYDFIEIRNLNSLTQLEIKSRADQHLQASAQGENRKNWEQKKIADKQVRKIQNAIEKCEKQIEQVQLQILDREKKISDPERASKILESKSFFEEYEGLKEQLLELENQWEKLHLELEELEKNLE